MATPTRGMQLFGEGIDLAAWLALIMLSLGTHYCPPPSTIPPDQWVTALIGTEPVRRSTLNRETTCIKRGKELNEPSSVQISTWQRIGLT